MKKIALIIPYYGHFPNYFNLFLKTCENNPSIDWIIFSDIETSIEFPKNVHKIQMSFSEIKSTFQEKFDFKISLNSPYKLCDYKPAYGYLFERYLDDYDFWGYCDVDMLFGNLRKFLPDDILVNYDKIGHLGHLTLYKNKPDINRLFMTSVNGEKVYKKVLSTDRICIFDEWGKENINQIFEQKGKRIYFWNDFCDIYPYDDYFREAVSSVKKTLDLSSEVVVEKNPISVLWDKGNIYRLSQKSGKLIKKECAYAHFQKRNMNINVDISDDEILCIPNQFIKFNDLVAIKKLKKRKVINQKKMKYKYKILKYYFIEKSGPVRHRLFRRKK